MNSALPHILFCTAVCTVLRWGVRTYLLFVPYLLKILVINLEYLLQNTCEKIMHLLYMKIISIKGRISFPLYKVFLTAIMIKEKKNTVLLMIKSDMFWDNVNDRKWESYINLTINKRSSQLFFIFNFFFLKEWSKKELSIVKVVKAISWNYIL